MADTVKLETNGQVQEVETKPLTLVCHRGDVSIKPVDSDVVVIEPPGTVTEAEQLTADEWYALRLYEPFLVYWRCVFPETKPPVALKDAPIGYRHVVGLILLMSRVLSRGLRPYVRFPETYLHPSQQLGLADLFLKFQGRRS